MHENVFALQTSPSLDYRYALAYNAIYSRL